MPETIKRQLKANAETGGISGSVILAWLVETYAPGSVSPEVMVAGGGLIVSALQRVRDRLPDL